MREKNAVFFDEISEFSPPKALDNYTVKLINTFIGMDTITTIKKK